MDCMVVAPHMDDESLGCGGLLAKRGSDSVVVTVTDNGPRRAEEFATAMGILGVTESVHLGLTDGQVPLHMAELVRLLDEAMATYQPRELYLPFPSVHQDHIATYEAGIRSARVAASRSHWFPPSVYVYDVAAYDLLLYPSDLRWNVFEPLTAEQVHKKHEACMAYQSEFSEGVHPMAATKEIAAAIGMVRLMEYAEQYALVRNVRS